MTKVDRSEVARALAKAVAYRDCGSVAAASPEEAVYRLLGGEYGRADFKAVERGLPFDPRPGYATTWPDRR